MSALNRFFIPALCVTVVLVGVSLPAAAQGSTEQIRATLGKSLVLDYPEDVARISTSNPDVVDYVPVSSREILLHAKSVGAATVVVWAKSGQRTFYNLDVEYNLDPMRKLLKETFPNEQIQVQSARDSVSLSGTVSNKDVSDRALAMMTPVSKSVVNNLHIRTAPIDKQIVLKVRFAEVDHQYGVSMGVNIVSTGAGNTIGRTTTGQFSAPNATQLNGAIGAPTSGASSSFNLTDALNIFAFRPDINIGVLIKLLQDQGVLQILAEPNLVTSNGKEASFLVGGEFPVPIVQGGSNAGAVTIQFREFGIRLNFKPELTENNTMKMYVKPEVSTIDLANAVSIQGFRIPALATRRIESNIELAPGQSFVIGGLIDDRTTDSFSKMPGLSSIPVLGVLFKSKEEHKTKTELLVLVTPEIVEPMEAGDPRHALTMPRELMPSVMKMNTAPDNLSESKSGPAAVTVVREPAMPKKK
jgi:pilus assembly protein CpaC